VCVLERRGKFYRKRCMGACGLERRSLVQGGICLMEPECLQLPTSSYTREQLIQRAMFRAGHSHRVLFVPYIHSVWSGVVVYNTGVPDLTEGLHSVDFGDESMVLRVVPVVDVHVQFM
jgi:hypothetical protein